MGNIIKDGTFHLVARIWLIMDGHVHIFIVVSPMSTTQNMDVHIHYQTIFWQPNENFHLVFSKCRQ